MVVVREDGGIKRRTGIATTLIIGSCADRVVARGCVSRSGRFVLSLGSWLLAVGGPPIHHRCERLRLRRRLLLQCSVEHHDTGNGRVPEQVPRG